jgi:phosphotransferase system enzyme I (PtsI)
MFPLISSVTELRMARALTREVHEELKQEGKPTSDNLNVGIMIEVPSAAAVADLLAKEVDFFSIGTNDLIQFFLAIDRDNADVSYLYEPFHPGVLRTIKFIVDSAHRNGIRVGMCGEMAADPTYTLLLVGLGLDEFSMNPVSIPLIKKIVRAVNRKEAMRVADKALKLPTAQEVEEFVLESLVSKFPHGYL